MTTVKTTRLPARLLKEPVQFLALGFGAGLSPIAPGTFGTLVALPLVVLLWQLPPAAGIAIVAVLFVGGIWLCGESARRLGVHDHSGVVFDEIAAFAALGLAIPQSYVWLGLAFVLFRVFDIFKPWPIRDLDHRLGGGLGIMLDDLLAALYAAVLLRLIEYTATVI